MKVADLYIRVSTDEQAEKGYSQRNQQDILKRYCEINEIKVRNVIYEDHSAKTFERPEWRKLLINIKSKKLQSELLLFTKWDRFSRNASDAYQMISILRRHGVEPQAIEQPLDLNVPENKMMLAVYLTAPEIENDRRALNVKHGLRQAKKEGRWMGAAPAGYVNKSYENGKKYIAISEPQASILKWAFTEVGKDLYTVAEVWRSARRKGLKIKINTFRDALKNVAYMGKILVPANQYEDTYLADGKHEPIITEALFYRIQEIIYNRQKEPDTRGIQIVSRNTLPLRGFLKCPKCERMLTGSASKGRNGYFHYYHCQSSCGPRFKASEVNLAFVKTIRKYMPKPGMSELYRHVVLDIYSDRNQNINEQKNLLKKIETANNRIAKARTLLLSDDIEAADYRLIKREEELNIVKYEAKIVDVEEILYRALENLKKLDLLYLEGENDEKRKIIGSIFPEKWTYDGIEHRTGQENLGMELIYLLNNKLEHKKTGVKTSKSDYSGQVPSAGVEPARFPTGV